MRFLHLFIDLSIKEHHKFHKNLQLKIIIINNLFFIHLKFLIKIEPIHHHMLVLMKKILK